MTRRGQWVLVAGIVLLLAGILGATAFLGDGPAHVTVGSPAPAFTARTVDAAPETRTLADYRGRVVLLNVWATWCGPCRVEMPSIEALHREFGPQGLEVVAVSIDEEGADEAIRDFVKEYGLTFDVLYDPSHRIEQAYQTAGVPETFVIGKDGVIRKRVIGATRWDSPANRALVRQLLDARGG
ncbi:MAG TPA: TlpA disulfide reductase family protein [Gemmatimonadaceae bacterium]|nr:TlpA disulfide reductase family protein [Gemmatimonadaceae bacterium]